MRHVTLLLALGLASGAFGLRSAQIEDRLMEVESRARTEEGEIAVLRERILEGNAAWERAKRDLAALERKHEEALAEGRTLAEARATLESELTQARHAIEAHATRLAAFETRVDAQGDAEPWRGPFEQLAAAVDERWSRLGGGVRDVEELVKRNESRLASLDGKLDRDVDTMWREVMGPTVQLSGESTVGSGVLLESEPLTDGGWRTHVLTAWHVVRDILADADVPEGPIPITIYAGDGSTRKLQANLLRFDPGIDVALLELDSRERFAHGARLASREHLAALRIFSNVYAAGCPLGNDPIPTFGEIADTHHVVDGDHYWMISAPTYVGNSGGGIFDADTLELIAIFSKIYTHGTLRPTVVPHMGLSTPLSVVYDWLEEVGYAALIPTDEHAPAPQTASAKLGERE